MMGAVKVLQVFGEPFTTGGQETFIMNMYRNMNHKKVVFDFFTPFYCDNFKLKEAVKSFGGKVFAYNGKFDDTGDKKDLINNANKFFSEHKYNIVHIHSGSTFALMMLSKIARKNGAKHIVIHSHCGGFDNLKYRIIKTLSIYDLMKYPTDYFACSEIAAKWKFPKNIIKNKKYVIIKNAIDTEEFYYNPQLRKETRKELGLEDKLIFGHVGRFQIQKNHPFLIEIFNEIHKKNSKAHLILVGDGKTLSEIENKVNDLNIKENVSFLGLQTDTNKFYNAMDAFILPSFFEGLPMVGVEAVATGLPVFLSTEVTREIPIRELTKYISLDESAEEWAIEILKYMKNFKRRNTTEQIKKEKFEIKIAAEDLQNIYIEWSKDYS